MERILQFSTNYVDTKQGLDIIESSVALTKESMNYSKQNILTLKKTVI